MRDRTSVLRIEVPLDEEGDADQLRSALVASRAFAQKFGEVRGRRVARGTGGPLASGTGDVDRRWEMLDRLIAAVEAEVRRG